MENERQPYTPAQHVLSAAPVSFAYLPTLPHYPPQTTNHLQRNNMDTMLNIISPVLTPTRYLPSLTIQPAKSTRSPGSTYRFPSPRSPWNQAASAVPPVSPGPFSPVCPLQNEDLEVADLILQRVVRSLLPEQLSIYVRDHVPVTNPHEVGSWIKQNKVYGETLMNMPKDDLLAMTGNNVDLVDDLLRVATVIRGKYRESPRPLPSITQIARALSSAQLPTPPLSTIPAEDAFDWDVDDVNAKDTSSVAGPPNVNSRSTALGGLQLIHDDMRTSEQQDSLVSVDDSAGTLPSGTGVSASLINLEDSSDVQPSSETAQRDANLLSPEPEYDQHVDRSNERITLPPLDTSSSSTHPSLSPPLSALHFDHMPLSDPGNVAPASTATTLHDTDSSIASAIPFSQGIKLPSHQKEADSLKDDANGNAQDQHMTTPSALTGMTLLQPLPFDHGGTNEEHSDVDEPGCDDAQQSPLDSGTTTPRASMTVTGEEEDPPPVDSTSVDGATDPKGSIDAVQHTATQDGPASESSLTLQQKGSLAKETITSSTLASDAGTAGVQAQDGNHTTIISDSSVTTSTSPTLLDAEDAGSGVSDDITSSSESRTAEPVDVQTAAGQVSHSDSATTDNMFAVGAEDTITTDRQTAMQPEAHDEKMEETSANLDATDSPDTDNAEQPEIDALLAFPASLTCIQSSTEESTSSSSSRQIAEVDTSDVHFSNGLNDEIGERERTEAASSGFDVGARHATNINDKSSPKVNEVPGNEGGAGSIESICSQDPDPVARQDSPRSSSSSSSETDEVVAVTSQPANEAATTQAPSVVPDEKRVSEHTKSNTTPEHLDTSSSSQFTSIEHVPSTMQETNDSHVKQDKLAPTSDFNQPKRQLPPQDGVDRQASSSRTREVDTPQPVENASRGSDPDVNQNAPSSETEPLNNHLVDEHPSPEPASTSDRDENNVNVTDSGSVTPTSTRNSTTVSQVEVKTDAADIEAQGALVSGSASSPADLANPGIDGIAHAQRTQAALVEGTPGEHELGESQVSTLNDTSIHGAKEVHSVMAPNPGDDFIHITQTDLHAAEDDGFDEFEETMPLAFMPLSAGDAWTSIEAQEGLLIDFTDTEDEPEPSTPPGTRAWNALLTDIFSAPTPALSLIEELSSDEEELEVAPLTPRVTMNGSLQSYGLGLEVSPRESEAVDFAPPAGDVEFTATTSDLPTGGPAEHQHTSVGAELSSLSSPQAPLAPVYHRDNTTPVGLSSRPQDAAIISPSGKKQMVDTEMQTDDIPFESHHLQTIERLQRRIQELEAQLQAAQAMGRHGTMSSGPSLFRRTSSFPSPA
ncbi:unnamed protein product [Somion occarium]|uniref:Uncharacterized protein n=1 Tax=Somion occarium TaxID=3059160 RepID=A0ABP1E9A1_9APHY